MELRQVTSDAGARQAHRNQIQRRFAKTISKTGSPLAGVHIAACDSGLPSTPCRFRALRLAAGIAASQWEIANRSDCSNRGFQAAGCRSKRIRGEHGLVIAQAVRRPEDISRIFSISIRRASGSARRAEARSRAASSGNVTGLEVAMDYPLLMRVVHCLACLDHQSGPTARVELAGCGIFQQWQSTDQLHGEIWLRPQAGLGSACFVNAGDSWMLQTAEYLGFLREPPQQLRTRQCRLNDLQMRPYGEDDPVGLINGPHTALADQSKNAISANISGAGR